MNTDYERIVPEAEPAVRSQAAEILIVSPATGRFYEQGSEIWVDFRIVRDGADVIPATVKGVASTAKDHQVELTPTRQTDGSWAVALKLDRPGVWWYRLSCEGGFRADHRTFVQARRSRAAL